MVALAGLAVMAGTYLVLMLGEPAGLPGWRFPTLSTVGILAWTAFGSACGLLLRPVLALTASILVPALVMILPAGWEPLWLRHLTGVLFDCCSQNTVLDPRAWAASVGTLAAVSLLALCVVKVRLAPAQSAGKSVALAGAAAIIGSLALAVPITGARDLGALPTQPRPTADLQCANGVCVWPEFAAARSANEAARLDVLAAWQRLGLPEVSKDFGPIRGPDLLPVTVNAPDAEFAVTSMAQALPRAVTGCDGIDHYSSEARNRSIDAVTYLLLEEVGVNPGSVGVTLAGGIDRSSAPRLLSAAGRC
jgi:hypothetical protein